MAYGTKLTRNCYFHSPYFFKALMSSAYGLQQRLNRYGKQYHRQLNLLRKSQTLDNVEITIFRNIQTITFINEAILNSPFYLTNKQYHTLESIDQISDLPVLFKEQVRDKQKDLVTRKLDQIPYRWAHTSGTTGKSLVFPLSNNCFMREYAFRGLHYEWGGATLHGRQRYAFCAGHPVTYLDREQPPFWVHDYSNNWLLLSSYHLSEKNLVHYINELDRFLPVLIAGYPSSIYILALGYQKYGTGKLRPISIFTSSETLLDYQRHTIETTFCTKVFNWYGNSEMVANIVECEKGELHLKHEHSFTEILDNDDRPCVPGETGRLVCTGFGNQAFPLIRYDIGDQVTISVNQTSKCGRNGLIIDRIDGRKEDYIITPDGRLVGRLDHLFKDSGNVREAQLYQNKVDEIILRIVKTTKYTKVDEQLIFEEARLRLGSAIKIRFDYIDSIERGKNGKFRFVISELDQQKAFNNILTNN